MQTHRPVEESWPYIDIKLEDGSFGSISAFEVAGYRPVSAGGILITLSGNPVPIRAADQRDFFEERLWAAQNLSLLDDDGSEEQVSPPKDEKEKKPHPLPAVGDGKK